MLQVLVDVLVPVYVVAGIGFVFARTLDPKPQTLATVAYWVLGPAFIFDLLATAELDPGVVGRVVAATALAMSGAAVLAAWAMRLLNRDFSTLAATVLTSAHGNVGNFGLAISAFALGESLLPVAGIVMVTVNTLGILIGVGLASIRHGSAWKAAGTAVATPMAVAVGPALAVNLSGVQLSLWIDRPVSLLAGAFIPVMLLTLGIQIALMPRVIPDRVVAVPIGIKLVAAPLAAMAAVGLLGLTGAVADVVILQAAMPAAVFTSLIALEHDLEADYVTSVVLTGTLVSAVSLPVVISLL